MDKGRRIVQAKSLAAIMNEVQNETGGAENRLQHSLRQLGAVIQAGNLNSSIEENLFPRELYQPAFNPPRLTGKVRLDFESREPDGSFSAQKLC